MSHVPESESGDAPERRDLRRRQRVAAYAVIARALRYDGSNLLARMILATPGFSYARLNNALGVPSTHDVEKRWKHFCRLTSTPKRAVRACYRAISAEPPVAPAQ